jgi:beta-glucanase (GH16 family)
MKRPSIRFLTILAAVAATFGATAPGQAAHQDTKPSPSLALLDMTPGAETRLRPNANNVSFVRSKDAAAPGFAVTVKPGIEGYPGISIRPPSSSWDLSAFGHVDARVTNTGTKPQFIALRVDNDGDWSKNPWNTESITVDPGATATITTIFGYSYGHQHGFALNPKAVANVMLFVLKSDNVQSFRIDSITAAGPAGEKPPVAPDEVRTKPLGGMILGYNATVDLSTQVQTQGIQPLLVGTDKQPSIRLLCPVSKSDQSITIRPPMGRWDLREFLQVQVTIRNMGKAAFTPRAKLETNGGSTAWASTTSPIAPGGKGIVTIPFWGLTPTVIGKLVTDVEVGNPSLVAKVISTAGTGSVVTSDAVGAITIGVDSIDAERIAYIDSIQASTPYKPDIPDWLGQRPPVEGDWVKTLDDEFDGTKLDSSIWSIYGENYYDKVTHWSKEDVIVGGGVVRLRYEKKLGFGNDDPKRPRSDYAAGYLQTYDKWTQRYGYFEARMKLPKAPGLWPAFWMMPDRGQRGANQGARQDTANGGMEFDIMEHLTRWGPNRYNISMHYDGYGVTHKSVGSDKIYVQPDKDGFITSGLLWTPGSAIFYCNGHEVLRWEDSRISNVPSYLLFTIPSGGWDNNSLEDFQLPDDFVIDYVRVWQRKDLASPADGKKAPAPVGSN